MRKYVERNDKHFALEKTTVVSSTNGYLAWIWFRAEKQGSIVEYKFFFIALRSTM